MEVKKNNWSGWFGEGGVFQGGGWRIIMKGRVWWVEAHKYNLNLQCVSN